MRSFSPTHPLCDRLTFSSMRKGPGDVGCRRACEPQTHRVGGTRRRTFMTPRAWRNAMRRALFALFACLSLIAPALSRADVPPLPDSTIEAPPPDNLVTPPPPEVPPDNLIYDDA